MLVGPQFTLAAEAGAGAADTAAPEAVALRGPWTLSLPRDHGSHPEAPAETWTIFAALDGPDGTRFDLVFSLLRQGMAAGAGEADRDPSPWDLTTLWAGQVMLIPSASARVFSAERYARVAGAAGHDAAAREVWIDDWTLSYGTGEGGQGLALRASAGGALLDLALVPEKPPLAPDAGDAPGLRGFALPRLAVTGHVVIDGVPTALSGSAWLDRGWGDIPRPGGPVARDRLILQLSDGRDLSLLRTRRIGRAASATLDAVLVEAVGGATYLDDATLTLEVQREAGDGSVAWQLAGAGLDLTATVGRWVTQDVLVPVRIGPVTVEGRVDGTAVQGRGALVLSEGAEQ